MIAGQEITVIGAGVAGLATARALALKGARVRLLEAAPEITEVGAGIQISPNGLRVLDALGLGQAARARALASQGAWLRDGPSGRSVVRINPGGALPFLLFHRADLIDLLAQGAAEAGVQIETGHRLEALEIGEGGARLVLPEGAEPAQGLVIGADGLASVVRPAVTPTARPFFTGQVAWRALVPAQGEVAPLATVFMGPGRHLVTYPLREGRLVNIVAVEERHAWAEEGWSQRGDPAELRAAFAGFCPEARALLERIEEVWFWGLFRHPVAAQWHRSWPGGAAAILGDAAHPTLPFMAQGAVMALEDAWLLADRLAGPGREGGLDPALTAWQAARRRRVARVVEAANANARNYHLANPLVRGLGHAGLRLAERLAPGRIAGRFAWIYDHDVTGGSQATAAGPALPRA